MSERFDGLERRRHPRRRISLRADVAPTTEDRLATFQTEDVSLGGMRVRGRLLLPKGEPVVVLLTAHDRVIPTLARVIETDVSVTDGWVELHLQFEHMSPSRRAVLAGVIDDAGARVARRTAQCTGATARRAPATPAYRRAAGA
jgi:hypothetical protein